MIQEPLPSKGLLDYVSRVDDLLVIVVQLLQVLLQQRGVSGPGVLPSIPVRYDIPVADVQRLVTSSTTYVSLVSWAVPSNRIGVLRYIELDSANFSTTRFRLEGAGRVLFDDLELRTALTLEFPEPKLAPGSNVTLLVKSSDGTEITAYGDIVGMEVVP